MSHAFSDTPYQQPLDGGAFAPPPREKRQGCCLLTSLGLAGLLILSCCGGLGTLGFMGFRLMTEEIEVQLKRHPALVEQVGEVQSIELDFVASTETPENVWVYRVRGSKGEGKLIVEHITNNEGVEEILSAKLQLPDGREVQLIPTAEKSP